MKSLAALLLILAVSPVHAKSVDVYIGGHYTCEFDGKPNFLNIEGPLHLKISQSGLQPRHRVAKLTEGDFLLKAKEFHNSTFHDVASNFPTQKNIDVAYAYFTGEDSDPSQVELSLAFKTQPQVYAFDRLKCRGESTMKKVPVVQVDCEIADLIKNVPTTTHVRFALANMINAYDFLFMSYAGDLYAQNPVQVTPKGSDFFNINKNLGPSLTRDYMMLEGGSFDQYRIFIRINRPSMTQGIAWLESGKEEVSESRRPVQCKVKGPVEPHPQERMH